MKDHNSQPNRPRRDINASNEHDNIERHTSDGPGIYVASLSDYNNGHLHGAWIEASADPAHMHHDITEMLAGSLDPNAEEWAIHDYEGFGPWQPSEYEPLDTIARITAGIEEHGPAFAHLAADVGTIGDVLDNFDDTYLGHWPNLTAYAEEVLEDLINLDTLVPDWIRPYIRVDIDAYTRDLGAELHTSDDSSGVHIFQP